MGSKVKGRNVTADDRSLEGKRRIAAIASIVAGAPNLLASLALFVLGVLGFLFLVYFLIALVFKDTGGDAFAGLIIVILIVLVIASMVVLLILLVLLLVLLIAVSGQVIGGILAYRGRRFGLSVALLIIGSVISFLSGLTMFVGAIIAGTEQIALMVLFILWGSYDVVAAVVAAISTIVVIGCRGSFVGRTMDGKKGDRPRKGVRHR